MISARLMLPSNSRIKESESSESSEMTGASPIPFIVFIMSFGSVDSPPSCVRSADSVSSNPNWELASPEMLKPSSNLT